VRIVEGHELAEAITGPELNAWYDASGNEIGDICAWTGMGDVNLNGSTFAVQPLRSNATNSCVLASRPPAADGRAGHPAGWPAGCRPPGGGGRGAGRTRRVTGRSQADRVSSTFPSTGEG